MGDNILFDIIYNYKKKYQNIMLCKKETTEHQFLINYKSTKIIEISTLKRKYYFFRILKKFILLNRYLKILKIRHQI